MMNCVGCVMCGVESSTVDNGGLFERGGWCFLEPHLAVPRPNQFDPLDSAVPAVELELALRIAANSLTQE